MASTTTLSRALEIIPMFTGSISIVGSVATMCIILRSYLKLSTTYHRILFGLTFCDVFQSLSLALSSAPVPKGIEGIIYAVGNQATCNVQGFISVFGISSLTFYYCGLTGYFLLAIKMELSDERMQKCFEPFVHIFSIGYGIIGATFVAFHSGFGTSGNSCWIAPKPFRCEKDADVECTSGGDFYIVRWVLIGGPMILCFCIIVVNMLIIFCSLASQNDKSHITLGDSRTRESTTIGTDENALNSPHPTRGERTSIIELYAASKQKKRKSSRAFKERRDGMIQALLYIFAFLLSYFFPLLYHALDGGSDKEAHVSIFLLAKILYPLQGLFNFFIFIRPRVINARRDNAGYSWFRAFSFAVKSRGDASNRISGRRRRLQRRSTKEPVKRRASQRFSMILASDVGMGMDNEIYAENPGANASVQLSPVQNGDNDANQNDDELESTYSKSSCAKSAECPETNQDVESQQSISRHLSFRLSSELDIENRLSSELDMENMQDSGHACEVSQSHTLETTKPQTKCK